MQTPQPPQKPQKRQVRLEIPNNLNATYSNAVMVSQTQTEIVLDFIQMMPNDPRARVQSRVVMTPANAKAFLQALQQNLEHFETRHGEIQTPLRPTSLAEQLFGGIKPDDDSDDDDDSEDNQD
jgi:hypothetical protein